MTKKKASHPLTQNARGESGRNVRWSMLCKAMQF